MSEIICCKFNNVDTNIHIYQGNETISNCIRSDKHFFELSFLIWIRLNFNEQNEILDIGANIGNHSLFFLKFLNCKKVHSFEPFESNLDLLKKNTQDFGDKSIIYDIALSNIEGTLPLYNSEHGNNGGFSLHSYSNGSSFLVKNSVNIKTLDSYNLNNITMIKIDVENHENEVLEGAKNTILRNKPIIFIENLYHGYPNVQPNPNPHQKIFEELNYKKIYSNILGGFMDLWVPIYMNSFSQSSQDIFVRKLTNNKMNGTFLEIGSNDPIISNNTFILEKENNYRGIMVDYDNSFINSYKIHRPNSIYIINDAQKVNYRDILDNNNFPTEIDYLQIDLDVNNRSTLNVLELLNNTVFDKYKFATITFEHDIYTGNYFNTRELSRKIFKDRGYILLFPDVSVLWENKYCQFEDWYVHKDLINSEVIDRIKTESSLTNEEIVKILMKL
jgi:FkbM family methyltransferase